MPSGRVSNDALAEDDGVVVLAGETVLPDGIASRVAPADVDARNEADGLAGAVADASLLIDVDTLAEADQEVDEQADADGDGDAVPVT